MLCWLKYGTFSWLLSLLIFLTNSGAVRGMTSKCRPRNPEFAGSNPAPASERGPEIGVFSLPRHDASATGTVRRVSDDLKEG